MCTAACAPSSVAISMDPQAAGTMAAWTISRAPNKGKPVWRPMTAALSTTIMISSPAEPA